MYVFIYICVYIYVYVYICIYIYWCISNEGSLLLKYSDCTMLNFCVLYIYFIFSCALVTEKIRSHMLYFSIH